MPDIDEESVFGKRPKVAAAHEIGQILDDLSARELAERIALMKSEIERLEKASGACEEVLVP